jgi:hypothetical protein
MLYAVYDYWATTTMFLRGEVKDPGEPFRGLSSNSILSGVGDLYCDEHQHPWACKCLGRSWLRRNRNLSLTLWRQIYRPARSNCGKVLPGELDGVLPRSSLDCTDGYSRVPYAAALDGNIFSECFPRCIQECIVFRTPRCMLLASGRC